MHIYIIIFSISRNMIMTRARAKRMTNEQREELRAKETKDNERGESDH